MKKIITLSCLMLLCSFAGMAQKFALIDMEYILKNIPAYEMTNEQLSQVSKKRLNLVRSIYTREPISRESFCRSPVWKYLFFGRYSSVP